MAFKLTKNGKMAVAGLSLASNLFGLGWFLGDRYDVRNPAEHSQANLQSPFTPGDMFDLRSPLEHTQFHLQNPFQLNYNFEAEGLRLGYVQEGDKLTGPYLLSDKEAFGTHAYKIQKDNQGRVIGLQGKNFAKPKKAKKDKVSRLEKDIARWESQYE